MYHTKIDYKCEYFSKHVFQYTFLPKILNQISGHAKELFFGIIILIMKNNLIYNFTRLKYCL